MGGDFLSGCLHVIFPAMGSLYGSPGTQNFKSGFVEKHPWVTVKVVIPLYGLYNGILHFRFHILKHGNLRCLKKLFGGLRNLLFRS